MICRFACRKRGVTRTLALVALAASVSLALGAGMFQESMFQKNKDSQQPDQVLYNTAVNDIKHGRYDNARIKLNTLINTYESSELLGKAKLAMADSWYRQGDAKALAQAEAEYKDFIVFYSQMPEAAEAQDRICTIRYTQMTKASGEDTEAAALSAERECKQVVEQYPDSKFVSQAQQMIRKIQEVRGEHK